MRRLTLFLLLLGLALGLIGRAQAQDNTTAFRQEDAAYQRYWNQPFGAPAGQVTAAANTSERVYFWKIEGGNGRIYVGNVSSAGAEPFAPLNEEAECVGCHAVSSTSGRIAAVLNTGTGPVVVKTFDGDDVPIPAVNASFVAWSPDGNRLAVSYNDRDIYLIDVEAGSLEPLAGASEPDVVETMPAWSPDGRTLAFVRAPGEGMTTAGVDLPSDIYVIPTEGGEAELLAGASGEGFNYYPAYSPDGRWLAFTFHQNGEDSYADNEADIYLVPSEGGDPILLSANSDASDSWPSWSGDGRWLAFNSNRNDGQFDVYLTEIGPTGESGAAVPMAAADSPDIFEHLPTWGIAPELFQEPTPALAPTATTLPTPLPTPLPPLTPTELVTMTITASPEEADTDQAITVQITLSGVSDECGQSIVAKPVDVILVLDSSGSMDGQPLEQAKNAAQAFVNQIDFSRDRVGIVQFSDSAALIHPLDTNADAINTTIDGIGITGGTAIHAGLQVAFEELQGNRREDATPVIVLLSDGESSRDAAQRVADTAKAAGMKVVTVGLGPSLDEDLMRNIASPDTNGQPQYYSSPDGSDLEQIYITIAQNIRDYGLASNLTLRHQLGLYEFFVVPESLNPPGTIAGDTITWQQDVLEDGDTVYTFQVRPRGEGGEFDIGELTEATFLECERTERLIQLPPGPRVTINAVVQEPPPVPFACQWWQTFPWWLLAPLLFLLLLLLFVLTPWGRRLWRKLKQKPLLCKLLALLTLLYLLFLLALLARALLGDLCRADQLYFWKITDAGQTVGIYESRFGEEEARPVSGLNQGSNCVACHAGSTEGQRLTAVRDDQNGPIVMHTVAGEEVILPLINGSYLAWSSDGNRAAISVNDQDIQILDLVTGSLTPLAGASDPNVVETMPSWSSDDQTIAFVRADSTAADDPASIDVPADIYTVPVAGGVALPLIGASGDGFNYYPAYSPDGRWLAFTRHTDGQDTYADSAADIYLVPAGGGERIFLRANSETADSWPSWSPDSQWLGFGSNRREGQFDVFLVNITPAGQSSNVYILPAAATTTDEEFHPVWIGLPELTWADRLMPLWPWLIPLLLLLFLGWLFCRERRYELSGQVTNALTREPIPGAQIKVNDRDLAATTDGSGRYLLHVAKGPLALTATAPDYSSQSRSLDIAGDSTLDFRLYPIAGTITWLQPPPPLTRQPDLTVWQPIPTLVIGLGGTGRYVLTHLKKNLLDAGAGTLAEKVRLVLLDTSDYELLNNERTPVTFAGVELDAEEIVEFGENLSELAQSEAEVDREIRDWFPTADYRTRLSRAEWNLSAGTRQRRPMARAAIVRDVHQGAASRLWQLLQQEAAAALDESDQSLRVILVGSLAGGFGSAVIADVAYLAQHAGRQAGAGDRVAVEAYLATQGVFARVSTRPELQAANSYASLRELERFQLAQGYPFRMVYSHEASQDPVLAGLLEWRLLDEVYLFDQLPNLEPANEAQARVQDQPAATLFPAIADAITFRLDKASRSGGLGEYRNTVEGAVSSEQKATGRAVVGSLGSYVYRLPMYDLVMQLNARWVRSLLRQLILNDASGQLRLDPSLNRENDPRAVADQVHRFLVGLAGYQEPPCPATTSLIGLLIHEGVSANFLEKLSENQPGQPSAEVAAFRAYLVGAIAIILNGRQESRTLAARGGKLGYALYFLDAVGQALQRATEEAQAIPTGRSAEQDQAAAQLVALLPQFRQVVGWLEANLNQQATFISRTLQSGEESLLPNGLYEQFAEMEQLHAGYLEEMKTILVRQYVHSPEMLAQWEKTYLFNNQVSEEALRRLYWQVSAEGYLTLTVRTWQENGVALGLDEPSQTEFARELLRLATYSTQEIWRKETLASALAQTHLLGSEVDQTAYWLYAAAAPLLDYDQHNAPAARWGIALGVNKSVTGAEALAAALRARVGVGRELVQVAITDPYTLLVNQTVDVIPLPTLLTFGAAEQLYQSWYGLIANLAADRRAEPTAVFRGEKIALSLEQRLQSELQQTSRLLRPIIVTALDSGGVARLYALALAAGWMQRTATGAAIHLPAASVLTLPKPSGEPAHPFVYGLVTFVTKGSPGDVRALQAAVTGTVSPEVVERWRAWTRQDWQNLSLAAELTAAGPDGADLAAVVALVCRDEIRRRMSNP